MKGESYHSTQSYIISMKRCSCHESPAFDANQAVDTLKSENTKAPHAPHYDAHSIQIASAPMRQLESTGEIIRSDTSERTVERGRTRGSP